MPLGQLKDTRLNPVWCIRQLYFCYCRMPDLVLLTVLGCSQLQLTATVFDNCNILELQAKVAWSSFLQTGDA